MDDRLKQVMAEILEVDVASINEETSQDSIDQWDSLKQMNLVVALEEEFDIEFEDEDIANLLNYKLIKLTIEEKI